MLFFIITNDILRFERYQIPPLKLVIALSAPKRFLNRSFTVDCSMINATIVREKKYRQLFEFKSSIKFLKINIVQRLLTLKPMGHDTYSIKIILQFCAMPIARAYAQIFIILHIKPRKIKWKL